MKKNYWLVVGLFILGLIGAAGLQAQEVKVPTDLRSAVSEKLAGAISINDAVAAQQWATTLAQLENARIAREAGDAVIPLIKGYASVTKEWAPQLEAAGPILKGIARSYISSQLKNGLIKPSEKASAEAVLAGLDAKSGEEVVAKVNPAIAGLIDQEAVRQKGSKLQWERDREEAIRQQKLREGK